MFTVKRILHLCIATCVFSLAVGAHAQPSLNDFMDFDMSGKSRTADVREHIDANIEKMDKVKEEVEKKVEDWGTGLEKWENFRGTDLETLQKITGDDSAQAYQIFSDCQELIHQHVFAQMLIPAVIVDMHCAKYHRYVGVSSGLCVRCDLNPTSFFDGCACKCKIADMVEYAYPAYKIDVSEQMFQSNYFPKDVVEENIRALREIDSVMNTAVAKNIELLQHKADQAAGRDVLAPGAVLDGKNLFYGNEDPDAKVARDAMKSIEEYRDFFPDHAFTAPGATKVYSRNIAESWNELTLFLPLMWSIPHTPRPHYFATDMPMGYAYSKFLMLSQNFQTLWGTFMSKGGERTCIRNNIATGKTSSSQIGEFEVGQREGTNLIPGLDSIPSFFGINLEMEQNSLCLKNVGEVFPVTDARRPHITDGTFIGVDKGMQIFQRVAFLLKHTYVRKADRFHVLRSKELQAESPKCEALDDMTRVNTAYALSNERKPRKGGENTFEVFPLFKGCWDFKGIGDWFWKTGTCPTDHGGAGGYHEFNLSGKLKANTVRLD